MAHKGETWNESVLYRDPISQRPVRRLTRFGLYNQTPTYHTNIAFTADGEYLVFATGRDGYSAVMKAHCATGDLTQLTERVASAGSRDELHKQNGICVGDGNGITGVHMCIAPHRRWCVFVVGRAVRAVHLDSLQERTLIADIGAEWIAGVPSISADEAEVLVPLNPAHPHLVAGERVTRPYMECLSQGAVTPALRILSVPLEGGEVTEAYHEPGCTGAHSPHSPVDNDLLLFDRDFPPRFWGGSDGISTRMYVWNRRTGVHTPLRSRNARQFQTHSVWSFDGSTVLYHGPAEGGGWYIGAVTPEGETVSEYLFPQSHFYGHVSADATRRAILLDGNLTPDLLLWLHYGDEVPRIEIIARHGTEWRGIHWQYSDPHPLADPTGRWISFNRAERGRTDVSVVQVGT